MQRSEWNPNSNRDPNDLWLAILVLVFVLMALSSIGCVSNRKSMREPEWVPSIYRFKPQEGRCVFYRASNKHKIDCDEPLIYDHVLIPAVEIDSLFQKLDMCEVWK